MLCKDCGEQEAKPGYYGCCSTCRSKRYSYAKHKICIDCGEKISNRSKRCSRCASIAQRRRAARICKECGKHYETKLSSNLVFCSKDCSIAYQTREMSKGGESSPAYKPTLKPEASGYIATHAFGENGRTRRVYEHTAKAEKILGRRIRENEVVHHINLNKSDNRNKNLIICSRSYHRWLHYQMELAWVKEHLK